MVDHLQVGAHASNHRGRLGGPANPLKMRVPFFVPGQFEQELWTMETAKVKSLGRCENTQGKRGAAGLPSLVKATMAMCSPVLSDLSNEHKQMPYTLDPMKTSF